MIYRIYGLIDPTTRMVRYVGKSVTSLNARLSNHIYKARSGRTQTPVGEWIRSLLSSGQRPAIVLLVSGEEKWQEDERAWIARLRAGGNLLNVNDGGNGAHTRAALPDRFVALLGKIPDSQIAPQAGLSREAISYHRRRLQIQPAPTGTARRGVRKGGPSHNAIALSPEVLARLGALGDRALASECGVARGVIRARRRAAGIAPFSGRHATRGINHHNAKLTADAVRDIRANYRRYSRAANTRTFAEKYGVDESTVCDVVAGSIWKEVA